MTSNSLGSDTGQLQPGFGPAEQAAEYFAARLTFHTDVSDVHSAMESGLPAFILIDTRGETSWAQGHIPGAVHLPSREISTRAPILFDRDLPIVTYCWGPGCDGATRGALEFARLGYRVKEMIGGFEYWAREGFAIESQSGTERRPVDALTAPLGALTCEC
jgi:rhodanese-related sulfurtransferase